MTSIESNVSNLQQKVTELSEAKSTMKPVQEGK